MCFRLQTIKTTETRFVSQRFYDKAADLKLCSPLKITTWQKGLATRSKHKKTSFKLTTSTPQLTFTAGFLATLKPLVFYVCAQQSGGGHASRVSFLVTENMLLDVQLSDELISTRFGATTLAADGSRTVDSSAEVHNAIRRRRRRDRHGRFVLRMMSLRGA